MAATVLSVCNQALGAVGAKGTLTSLGDKTREAEVCNLFYADTRDSVFSAAHWPSLNGVARLNRIDERDFNEDWTSTNAVPGTRFSYRLPADYSYPRYLADYSPFQISNIGSELTLQSDTETPLLHYTRRIEEPQAWDVNLRKLVVASLAMELGRALQVDASAYARAQENWRVTYQQSLTIQSNVNNKLLDDFIPDAILAREGGSLYLTAQRFFYPVQVLSYGQH